jgi:hypothetical protein
MIKREIKRERETERQRNKETESQREPGNAGFPSLYNIKKWRLCISGIE